MVCAAGVVSTRNSSGRRMGESVSCGLKQRSCKTHNGRIRLCQYFGKFGFALSETSPNSRAAVVRACVNGPISWEQVRTKTYDSCSKRCKAGYEV